MTNFTSGETLGELLERQAELRPDQVFFVFEKNSGECSSYTYRRFNAYVNQVANCLIDSGVEQGESVAIHLDNSPEVVATHLAVAKIGAVAVPINTAHTKDECIFAIDRCGVEKVVTDWRFLDYYSSTDCKPLKLLAVTDDPKHLPEGVIDFRSHVASQPNKLIEVRPIGTDDTIEILFTSGTTSSPKGVELSHANFLFSGAFGNWEYAMRSDDCMITAMPTFHSNFQTAALTPVLSAGAKIVLIDHYSARRFWKQVRKHQATLVQLSAMLVRTMMLQDVDKDERDHCVRSAQYYLNITTEEKEAFEERFGVHLHNCFGLTESVCWSLTDPPLAPGNWPSIGRAGMGYEVEIFDEKGSIVPIGEIGEIRIHGQRGLSLMKGYYKDPEATAAALTADDWLLTGDKGYRDAQGWFYFVDRKCNMIKRAGENISTTEVEDVLAKHPAVAESAVIGVPDSVRDMAVKAFVSFKNNASATERELTDYCRHYLASFKVPTIFEFVDELPHTSVGKVEKKLLS